MKFDIKVRLNLDFLGEGWADCYINFSPVTVKQAKEFRNINPDDPNSIDKGIEILKEMFIDGKGYSDGKYVDLAKDNIDDLPLSVINKSIETIVNSIAVSEKKIQN